MTLFRWRLDRVLEIKMKEEKAKQAELADIMYQLAQTRVQLLQKQRVLAGLLNEIKAKRPKDKLRSQQIFLESSEANDNMIRHIQKKVSQFEQEEARRTTELMEIKASIKKLQKIRQKAYDVFIAEQNRRQQNELDENFGLRIIRGRSQKLISVVKGEL